MLIFFIIPLAGGCERSGGSGNSSTTRHSKITVASLVPAATDLIIGMGCADHLAAVSTWDASRLAIAGLPRVGDYRNVDWEKLAQIRPDVMIVQYAPEKMPPGFTERAKELGIHLVNVHNNQLADIFSTIQQLGQALDEPDKADTAGMRLRKQLNAVSQSVAGELPVRTFIGLDATSLATVGGGNYLNEILGLAGGKNVVQGGENAYPTIDREKLVSLDPEVVIVLLPSDSDQLVQEAEQFWNQMKQVRAVQEGRVYIWTEPWLLLPGWEVGDLAKRMAKVLHPHVRNTRAGEPDAIDNCPFSIVSSQLGSIPGGAS